MKVFQTDNHLIIKENPGCFWLFGLFFAFFGVLFIYGAYNGFTFFGIYSPWTVGFTFLLGLIGIGIGFWAIYKNQINNLEIDKIKNEVAVIRWGVFGKRTTVFHFDEIEKFCLIAGKNNHGLRVWDFGIELMSGEKISITSLGIHTEDYENKYVYPLNVFIGKELPACQINFEPQDEDLGQ
jgi:hypothetical protein